MNRMSGFFFINLFITIIYFFFKEKFYKKHSFYSLCKIFLLIVYSSIFEIIFTALYRVLDAEKSSDTGDENILIFGVEK